MDKRRIKDVRAQLARERHVMHYFKDRYAAMLLHWLAGDRVSISRLKASRFAGLLEKPAVKGLLASLGNGMLDPVMMDGCMAREHDLAYRVTFGQWPLPEDEQDRFWDQVSTRGYTLVVQLNFTGEHDEALRRTIGSDCVIDLADFCHPINQSGRNTLAWARIDLDLDRGEALIEEIQSDWVRNARRIYDEAMRVDEEARGNTPVLNEYSNSPVTAADFCRYYETCLQPHLKVWSEATLAAALGILIDILSVRRIWMHSVESGNRLKYLEGHNRKPPVSLYSDLPRRFCFEKTPDAPAFLMKQVGKKQRSWLKSGGTQFWHHAF